MQNPDVILLSNGRVSMSLETYAAIKAFCAHHGETDLPNLEPVVDSNMTIRIPQPLEPRDSIGKIQD